MRRFERLLVVVFFHFARQWLLRVLLIVRERGQRFIVADLRRVRWLEGLVMLHGRDGLSRRGSRGERNILTNHGLVRIEEFRLFDLLGEGLFLHESLSSKTLFPSNFLWAVKVALHVGDGAAERGLLTDVTFLRWVDQEIAWRDHNLVVVFWVAEVLVNMLILLHVLEGSVVPVVSNVLGRLERFLITVVDLLLTVLFTHNLECGLLKRVANAVISVLAEQVGVNLAPLDRVGADVGRVRSDLLRVRVRDEPR